MTDDEQQYLDALAGSTALMLLMKHVIGMVYFHADAGEFRRRLAALDATVNGELSRTTFASRDDATTYARETASMIVTNILASVVHADDVPGDDP